MPPFDCIQFSSSGICAFSIVSFRCVVRLILILGTHINYVSALSGNVGMLLLLIRG